MSEKAFIEAIRDLTDAGIRLRIEATSVCGAMDVDLSAEQAVLYLTDREAAIAAALRVAPEEYLEWLGCAGTPLCGATTRAGKLCSNPIGCGGQHDIGDWLDMHRYGYCAAHRGEGSA